MFSHLYVGYTMRHIGRMCLISTCALILKYKVLRQISVLIVSLAIVHIQFKEFNFAAHLISKISIGR